MYKLYDYQKKAILSILNFLTFKKKGNPLIVAPTGSGKSIIIAELCKIILKKKIYNRILILTHNFEIINQDYKVITEQIGEEQEIGIFSSGLKRKEIKTITIAGIQSAYKQAELFTVFDFIIIDEAHMISNKNNSMYQLFFLKVKKPTVGFTATPYRTGLGYIHLSKEAFFTSIIYHINISTLQTEGKLCQIISKQPPHSNMDTSGIKKQHGDFSLSELSIAFDRNEITKKIIQELQKYKKNRKKWLVYSIDIEHCDHIATLLNEAGIKTLSLHSKSADRQSIIQLFKTENYQAIVSVAMLTTGIDIPEVDLLVLLRPTASPQLHVQIIGRGMRVASGKENCLVLDFAGNLLRNGPIDKPHIKTPGKKGGEAVMKVCDQCNEIVPIATKKCPSCGKEFKFKHNLTSQSSSANVVSTVSWYDVNSVQYFEYIGKKEIPILLVIYSCGLKRFKEYVCLEHPGMSQYITKQWMKKRFKGPIPDTVKKAIMLSQQFKKPKKILVDEAPKYPNIQKIIL